MTAGGRFTFTDMQNLLFLHPSDGPLSISVEKLQGAGDFRSWKRLFEIQLSAKRKLGFLNGTVERSTTDEALKQQWDTCNDMVISWLHNNVLDTIKKSILFISTAHEIWKTLEKRFHLSNGSRKYKLNKDLLGMKQGKMKVNEYFTGLSSLWEEIDSMNLLPGVTTVGDDVKDLLKAIETQKEESKLFVFLNGLDETYGPMRSQLLMQIPLPTIEAACAFIQQEESQRDALSLPDTEYAAMFSQSADQKPLICNACGGR